MQDLLSASCLRPECDRMVRDHEDGTDTPSSTCLSDPLSNSRGRVPKAHFEEFKKGGRTGHTANGSIDK
jgi:hypothetical protein